jgi:putative DNA methylase
MTWDFAETNPFTKSSGTWTESVDWVAKVVERVPAVGCAEVSQADASSRTFGGFTVSTDPPYYDNIGYSDLSDFFYVWLRRSLRSIHPDLFATMLVPKAEELVANPYRHGGKDGAREFFEGGFRSVFARARETAFDDYPITVWYAFKQSEDDDSGEASTGWETLLEGMIRSGWRITATWPNRSELGNRMMAKDMNALASSIVLSLRPRPVRWLTAVGLSRLWRPNSRTRCASFSRDRSRRLTCHRLRSALEWLCTAATAG